MNNALKMDVISSIDDDIIENGLKVRNDLIEFKISKTKRKNKFKWKYAVALVACLTLICVTTISFLPAKYDLNYSYIGDNGEDILIADKIVTIYYCEDGKTKSERVSLPCSLKNVFLAWKHLNNIEDDNVVLLTGTITNNGYTNENNGIIEYVPGDQRTLTIVISNDILKYINNDNFEKIIDSLKKTYQYVPNIDIYDISIKQS